MKPSKTTILTVCLPMLLGFIFYHLHITNPAFKAIKNYLPDGLWAFSLTSVLWMIWDGAINWIWVIALCLLYISFELLQYIHFIAGTADIMDIITYFTFTLLSITLNKKITKTAL